MKPDLSKLRAAIEARLATLLASSAPSTSPSVPDPPSPSPPPVAAPSPTSARPFWQQSAERLRGTTRWILAVFGTIGVVFLGALPFSGLASVSPRSPEAALVACGIILLVGGLALVLRAGSEVFISRAGSLTDFDVAWQATSKNGRRPFGLDFARYEVLNGLASDTSELVEVWEQARLQKWRMASTAATVPSETSDPRKQLAQLAEARFAEIDAQVDYLMGLASYRRVLWTFRAAQLWLFLGATLVALGGALYFFAVEEEPPAGITTSSTSVVVSAGSTDTPDCDVSRSDEELSITVPPDRTCVVEHVPTEAATGRDFPSWVASWCVPAGAFGVVALLLVGQWGHFKLFTGKWPRTRLFD